MYRDGFNATLVQGIPEQIYNYTVPPGGWNETRRGYVDDDGFMEEILSGLGYQSEGFSTPIARFGPNIVDPSLAMMDLYSHPVFKKEIIASLEYDVPVISEVEDLEFLLQHIQMPNDTDYSSELRSFTLDQVKESFDENSKTVGYLVGVVPWSSFFSGWFPNGVNGVAVKVVSDCGRNFTYIINGDYDDWAANGDHHDPKYADMVQQYKFFWKDHPKGTSRHCHFDLYIYPSDEFAALYETNDPIKFAAIVAAVFVFTALVFFLYDCYVHKRQKKLKRSAERAENLVTSLFPKQVGEQLMEEADKDNKEKDNFRSLSERDNFLNEEGKGGNGKGKPIADLYPDTTVMFADIVGFTSWASTREVSVCFLSLGLVLLGV